MDSRNVTKTARPTRTFNLTDDLCKYIDTLPNRSAWLRELLETVVIKKETLVTEAQVLRLIERYAGRMNLTPIPQSAEQDLGILDELDAILVMGNSEERGE